MFVITKVDTTIFKLTQLFSNPFLMRMFILLQGTYAEIQSSVCKLNVA